MDENIKYLLGNSIPIPEVDIEDQENRVQDSENDYILYSIISTIGTPQFQSIFTLDYNLLLKLDFEKGAAFARQIIDAISRTYSIDFELNINTSQDILDVYQLIRFIEYDHVNFLVEVFYNFKEKLKTQQDLEKILYNDSASLIEQCIKYSPGTNLISKFFREYENIDILTLLSSMLLKSKFLIWIEISLKQYKEPKEIISV